MLSCQRMSVVIIIDSYRISDLSIMSEKEMRYDCVYSAFKILREARTIFSMV